MKYLATFCFALLFVSCDYFNIKEAKSNTSDIVAIVNTEKLFKSDIKSILPENISKQDSIIIVKSYINDWAIKQLLLKKAKNNSSLATLNEIDNLVKDYKESLLINKYKEELIKQQLDTIVSRDEVAVYYSLHKENFKLNEVLVKAKYLHFSNDVSDKDEFISLFKSDDIEDTEELEESQLSFNFHHFNDSTWVPLDKVMLKVPFSKENLLKKTKFVEKQDSLGIYLVAIKDVLRRNDIAPLNYIAPTIKKMILHKRKIELIRDIEKILIKDATENNNFKTY
jgi:hypothetical protein